MLPAGVGIAAAATHVKGGNGPGGDGSPSRAQFQRHLPQQLFQNGLAASSRSRNWPRRLGVATSLATSDSASWSLARRCHNPPD